MKPTVRPKYPQRQPPVFEPQTGELRYVAPYDGQQHPEAADVARLDRYADWEVVYTEEQGRLDGAERPRSGVSGAMRSEEHTSELQSRLHLVCRLLLEKKK